jgi:hypothetical protein
MRDLLALDREALQQSLTGIGATNANAEFRWIPSIGQMTMGFILPFALAFIAIPLESFIHSLRTVLGSLAIGMVRALRVIVRMTGGIINHLSKMLVSLYDLIIMLPLSAELIVKKYSGKSASDDNQNDESTNSYSKNRRGNKEVKALKSSTGKAASDNA